MIVVLIEKWAGAAIALPTLHFTHPTLAGLPNISIFRKIVNKAKLAKA